MDQLDRMVAAFLAEGALEYLARNAVRCQYHRVMAASEYVSWYERRYVLKGKGVFQTALDRVYGAS